MAADHERARVAAGKGRPQVPGLVERDYGPAEGLCAGEELDALRFPGGFHGAETEAGVADRGIDSLRLLAREHPGARIIVVAHGTLIRLSLAQAFDRQVGSIDNAALTVVRHHADGWQLDVLNGEALDLVRNPRENAVVRVKTPL
jgi:probable phosphoglycerate mutase